MPIIVLRFSDYRSAVENRPDKCPYCDSQVLQKWGSGSKTVQDSKQEVGEYHRYRCSMCGRTFRHYAPGLDKTRLTQRIRKMAAIAWALGISAREVAAIFDQFGVELGFMTIWRDGNDLVTRHRDVMNPDRPDRYNIDKLFMRNTGRGIGTTIVVDLGDSKTVALGRMDEVNYRNVLAWLEPILRDLDIHVSVLQTGSLAGLDDHF
jgi:DNA-directed RNA polymerase subunit RPC12/RpoP